MQRSYFLIPILSLASTLFASCESAISTTAFLPIIDPPSQSEPDVAHPQFDLPGFTLETRNYEQSKGSYATNGSLINADRLDLAGLGFIKIFTQRDRGYASLDLVSLLEKASSRLFDFYPDSERLQVGDMSKSAGGRAGGHSSHQNGLDADVVYFKVDKREMSPTSNAGGATGFDEKFVKNNRITSNFDTQRNWQWLEILASTKRVQRIFVDPVVKATFCQYAKDQGIYNSSTEALRMLRPWPLHDDHMHVRITCPKASPQCVAQVPPPVGSSCEEALAEVIFNEQQITGQSHAPESPLYARGLLKEIYPMIGEFEAHSKDRAGNPYDFGPAFRRSIESKAIDQGEED